MGDMTANRVGFLPVDKPEGPTSHDVVALARQALGTRRIGHTGTLDPFASGLILLCVGRATRLAEYLTGLGKSYRGVAHLGVTTATADRTGEVIRHDEGWRTLSTEAIEAAFRAQVGAIEQVPPAYSAKKVAGVRAYDLARRGEEVQLRPVRVEIERIEIIDIELPEVTFDVDCSSGTYIRSIARDVGEALGVGAHLSALRRTRVGSFTVADAVPADRLDDPERVARAWISPLTALAHLPRLEVGDDEARALRHGVPVPAAGRSPVGSPVALVHAGELLAVGAIEGEVLRARKVFAGD
jgi:tRNA pseudouridine55 synthase